MRILVKAKGGRSFRRAGLVFGPEPLELDTEVLGPERTAAIQADESLEVAGAGELELQNMAAPPAVTAARVPHPWSEDESADPKAPSSTRKGKR